MNEEKSFASRIKDLITELKISQAEFGRLIDKKPAFISEVVSGRSLLSAESLTLLRSKLNVNPLWLLAGEGEMFVSESAILDEKESEEFRLVNVYLHQNMDLFEFIQNLKKEPRKSQGKVICLLGKLLGLSTKDLERLEAYLDGMGK